MATVDIDGIETHYEVLGDGPPLLMFSPGGFNAVVDNWRDLGLYRRIKPLDHLPKRYSCIVFDRREAGRSGGRLERVSWTSYITQASGLLHHLDVERAHLMGACVGCSSVAAFAVAHPERVRSMVLYSPAGGPRYRITSHARFWQHLAYVQEHGLEGVLQVARTHDEGFSKDPRVGPWVAQLRRDPAFAERYVAQDPTRYAWMVGVIARTLFDRDTVPGVEAEDLLRLDVPALVVPGQDASHATSAARYLEECLPDVEYWDVPVVDQTEENAPKRILEFLDRH